MPKKPLELLLLGEGPVAAVLSLILRMPLVGRNTEDTEWTWPKVSLADKVKLLFVVPGHAGLDRIVRLHAEVWDCPKVSRLGVVMVVPDHGSTARLLERDVFGRKGITTSRFCDWRDVINIPRWQISLNEILDAVSSVAFLPIDTWRRESKNASCIPSHRNSSISGIPAGLEAPAPRTIMVRGTGTKAATTNASARRVEVCRFNWPNPFNQLTIISDDIGCN